MKISDLKKSLFLFSATLFFAVSLISCNKDRNNSETGYKKYTLSGTASGSQVFPSVATTALATMTGTYDAGSNTFSYTINWNGLSSSATGVELRGPANPGENGFSLYTLSAAPSGVTGSASGQITIAPNEYDLLSGKLYYVIKDAGYPAGEIRAQVTATAQ